MSLIDVILRRTRVLVRENERVLVLIKGRFHDILMPGEHVVPDREPVLETLRADRMVFDSVFARALFTERPDLAARHMTVVQAAEGEVVVAFRDGVPAAISTTPKTRIVLLNAAGPYEVQRYVLDETLALPEALRVHAEAGAFAQSIATFAVQRGQVGLLSVGHKPAGTLGEGTHLFLKTGRDVSVRIVDTQRRTREVTGQEVLTQDRVTVRVNISADYRVVDPELAVNAVRDFDEALHRALQLAFRRTVGQRTLDQMLADKVSVDDEATEKVRTEMAAIGVQVGDIALKDVILPGEMREILNQVVAAEKEAEANLIRRREETQATRSLLNTAKVMEENPVMLRLKELEALTELAGKVDTLTVHNGTDGLLNDLVKLRS